ncbi:MAG: hypothetical protein DWG76_06345 [Chloroflexi bacterium]|nr:hypothetical protein [Chloroflexota bacterium]
MAQPFKVRISGDALLKSKLEGAAGDVSGTLVKATHKAVTLVHQEIPAYPPPPPLSHYRRTGTLGRTITTMMGAGDPNALSRVEALAIAVKGFIGTRLKYAPWVIDEKRQVKAHRGRWYTLQEPI